MDLALTVPVGLRTGGLWGAIFHYFPITKNLALIKCRQFSVLGFTRGSLGSFYTAIVRRPLIPLAC